MFKSFRLQPFVIFRPVSFPTYQIMRFTASSCIIYHTFQFPMLSVANIVAESVYLNAVFDGAQKIKDTFEGIVVSLIIRQIYNRDQIDIGIFGKIQFVNERRNLSNNRVRSLPTEHLMFIRSAFRFVNYTETKLDLVANVELFPTVFGIIISFGEYVNLIYNCLYVFLQMFFYKSFL